MAIMAAVAYMVYAVDVGLQEVCSVVKTYNVRGVLTWITKGCRNSSECTADMYTIPACEDDFLSLHSDCVTCQDISCHRRSPGIRNAGMFILVLVLKNQFQVFVLGCLL